MVQKWLRKKGKKRLASSGSRVAQREKHRFLSGENRPRPRDPARAPAATSITWRATFNQILQHWHAFCGTRRNWINVFLLRKTFAFRYRFLKKENKKTRSKVLNAIFFLLKINTRKCTTVICWSAVQEPPRQASVDWCAIVALFNNPHISKYSNQSH